ncbi:MAG: hypothetical protein P4L40_04920 [Terracidiphilus sp.]|nr:hypothetical protein [Terracidiphilus sp.]
MCARRNVCVPILPHRPLLLLTRRHCKLDVGGKVAVGARGALTLVAVCV